MNARTAWRRWFGIAVCAAAAAAAAGCTHVRPWERGALSDYTMRPDRDPLEDTLTEHVYFTREAASGGRGVGGGGCGCN
jgi:hypothetical protein